MKIGIIGVGAMGAAMGDIWAKAGHEVLFSFSRDRAKLEAVAKAAGPNATAGDPKDVTRQDIVVLAAPWGLVDVALAQAGDLRGKTVFSCVNSLNRDMSGLEVGTTTSAAEEIAKKIPSANVVEALPPMAQIIASDDRTIGGERITVFYCGNDAEAKTQVMILINTLGFDAVDAGPLTSARFIEPAGFLTVQLAYQMQMGTQLGFKLLHQPPN